MKRAEYGPEWSEPHLLSFVTNASGKFLTVHADLAGITMLIDELECLRAELELNRYTHSHLFSFLPSGSQLTTTKIAGDECDVNIVEQVDICGWDAESARENGLV